MKIMKATLNYEDYEMETEMTRCQAIDLTRELKNKFKSAIEDEEYCLEFDIDEDTFDIIDALNILLADAETLQDIIDVTDGILRD